MVSVWILCFLNGDDDGVDAEHAGLHAARSFAPLLLTSRNFRRGHGRKQERREAQTAFAKSGIGGKVFKPKFPIGEYGFCALVTDTEGNMLSMPFNSSTPIMYYNKDMFDKAGITEIPDSLEGIGEIGQDLLDKGGAGEVMSLGIYGWFFEQFIGKQGLEYANNGNGRKEAATAVAFDENDAAKNILTAWKDLNDKGFAPVVGKGGDAGLADFSAGKSAITLGSTASLKQILQDVNGKFEVGTAYFPKIKSSDEGGVSIGGASLWALNNNDPKKLRATWEFVKFLISPESQAYWNAQTGYFPVTVKSQEEQVFKDNVAKYPQFQTAIDQLHDSSADYVGALLSVFPEARATVESEIESMLNGKEDVDTAVKNMADSINKSIEEYNLVNE